MLRLIAGLAIAVTLGAPKEDDRGRPVVLLVHGRGLLDRDTAATRKMWFDAISSGAGRVDGQRLYSDRDLRVVWYADVLDPRSPSGCDYKSSDARARRANSDPELRQVVSTAGSILGAITALVDDSGAVGQLRALSADAAFLTDMRKRCAAEQRLGDALDQARKEGRPVILVAHSLGAVVAYDYLSTRADTGLVERLVTIGSLVGSPDLRRLLIGGDEADTLTRPPSVKSWINIRNDNDWFAAPITVGKDVVTAAPSGEPDPHEMVGYLRGSATNVEVAADWCAAFASKAPAACASVRRSPP
jgi:pimeloyl-ACP methyl ester carboxylesterase